MSNPATDGQSDSSTKLRKVTICTDLSGILTMADDLGWSKEQRQSLEPLIAQLRSKETPSDGPVVYMSDTNDPNGFFMLNASRNSDGMTDGIGVRHCRFYQIDPKDANSDENGRPTWTASQKRPVEYYDSIEPTMIGEWASYKHGLRCALRDQLLKSKFEELAEEYVVTCQEAGSILSESQKQEWKKETYGSLYREFTDWNHESDGTMFDAMLQPLLRDNASDSTPKTTFHLKGNKTVRVEPEKAEGDRIISVRSGLSGILKDAPGLGWSAESLTQLEARKWLKHISEKGRIGSCFSDGDPFGFFTLEHVPPTKTEPHRRETVVRHYQALPIPPREAGRFRLAYPSQRKRWLVSQCSVSIPNKVWNGAKPPETADTDGVSGTPDSEEVAAQSEEVRDEILSAMIKAYATTQQMEYKCPPLPPNPGPQASKEELDTWSKAKSRCAARCERRERLQKSFARWLYRVNNLWGGRLPDHMIHNARQSPSIGNAWDDFASGRG